MIECDIARTSGRWTSCYDLTADREGMWQGPACAERPFGGEAKGFAGGEPGRNPWVLLGRDGGKEARAGEPMAVLPCGVSGIGGWMNFEAGGSGEVACTCAAVEAKQEGARDDAVVKVRRCVGHGFELDDVGKLESRSPAGRRGVDRDRLNETLNASAVGGDPKPEDGTGPAKGLNEAGSLSVVDLLGGVSQRRRSVGGKGARRRAAIVAKAGTLMAGGGPDAFVQFWPSDGAGCISADVCKAGTVRRPTVMLGPPRGQPKQPAYRNATRVDEGSRREEGGCGRRGTNQPKRHEGQRGSGAQGQAGKG